VTSITDTTNPAFATPKQLTPPVEVKFAMVGGNLTYSLYNSSTSVLLEGPINYTSGNAIFPTPGGLDYGYRVTISGNIQPGDTFNINYNTDLKDNRNGKDLEALYTQNTVLGAGGQTVGYSQAYTQLRGSIATTTNTAKGEYENADKINQQAQDRRERVSGVSLEQETLDITRFEQNYQASMQILEAARAIMRTIMEMMR
jgi:flagellar hook-associated protein 1 FlgK